MGCGGIESIQTITSKNLFSYILFSTLTQQLHALILYVVSRSPPSSFPVPIEYRFLEAFCLLLLLSLLCCNFNHTSWFSLSHFYKHQRSLYTQFTSPLTSIKDGCGPSLSGSTQGQWLLDFCGQRKIGDGSKVYCQKL